MSGWDRQINGDGDTVADMTADRLGDVRDSLESVVKYLDVIAECLVAMAFKASPDGGLAARALLEVRGLSLEDDPSGAQEDPVA